MFKVGDCAIYPPHGVAIVKRIEERAHGDKQKKFYVLETLNLNKPATLWVAADNADAVGLRQIIDEKTVREVYKILKKRDIKINQTTWNRRYREYKEKIETGSIFEIAEVLRNLFLLRSSKDLSFGERKMLEDAKKLLVKEISLAKRTQEDTVEREIHTIFAS